MQLRYRKHRGKCSKIRLKKKVYTPKHVEPVGYGKYFFLIKNKMGIHQLKNGMITTMFLGKKNHSSQNLDDGFDWSQSGS